MPSVVRIALEAAKSGGDPAKYNARIGFYEQVEAWRSQGHKTLPPATLKNIGPNAEARRQAWIAAGFIRAGNFHYTGSAWDVWNDTKPDDPDFFEKVGGFAGDVVDKVQDVVNSVPGVKAGGDWLGDRLDDIGINKSIRQDLAVSLPAGFFTGGLVGIAGSEFVQARGDLGKTGVGTLAAVGTGVASVALVTGAQAGVAAIGGAAGAGGGAAGGLGIAGAGKFGTDKLRGFATGDAKLPDLGSPSSKPPPPKEQKQKPTVTTSSADPSRLIDAQKQADLEAAIAKIPELTFWRWIGIGGPLRLISDLVKGNR